MGRFVRQTGPGTPACRLFDLTKSANILVFLVNSILVTDNSNFPWLCCGFFFVYLLNVEASSRELMNTCTRKRIRNIARTTFILTVLIRYVYSFWHAHLRRKWNHLRFLMKYVVRCSCEICLTIFLHAYHRPAPRADKLVRYDE